MNLGIGLGLLLEIELGLLFKLLLKLLEGLLLLVLLPQEKYIFREYIFIEVKLLPLTAPYSKPIPIPPSRPNDLKHIAIMFNLILMFMIFLILLLVAAVMTTATYRSVVNKQRRDWREHGRAGETYEQFCSRYYTRYV